MSNKIRKLLKRSEVPNQEKWNLTTLFDSRESVYKASEELLLDLEKISKFKGSLMKDANTLYDFILSYDKVKQSWLKLSAYGFMVLSVDATSSEYMEDSSKIRALSGTVSESLAFIKNEICSASREKLNSFYEEKPELEKFKLAIENIYKYKEYLFDEKTEKVLAAFTNTMNAFDHIYEVSSSSDMHFDSFDDGEGNILENSFTLFEEAYQSSDNTTLRRNAFDSFNKGLKKYNATYGAVYASEVNKQVTEAKLRGFDSTIDMLLFEQGVEREAYDTQLKVIFENLAPHMRRYANILKKRSGLDELRFSDLKLSLDEEYSPDASFDEVKKIVLEALSIYGDEYMENMHGMFNKNLIDYSQNIGKSSGAYCISPHGSDSFIKMTFTGTMRSAFTLVHELGHAGHFQLANKYQNCLNSDCSMYVVESPSTMNELILGKHLMSIAKSPEFERWVIIQILDTYYHNSVTHFLEARLQDRVYKYADEGGQINAEYLNKTKLEVIKEFWADSVNVEDEAGLTWMRQSHYYCGLYPYTYSASLSVSTHTFKMIEKEGKPAMDKWLEFLKTGGSLKTSDLAKIVGIDISKPDIFLSMAEYVGNLVDRLEELYK